MPHQIDIRVREEIDLLTIQELRERWVLGVDPPDVHKYVYERIMLLEQRRKQVQKNKSGLRLS